MTCQLPKCTRGARAASRRAPPSWRPACRGLPRRGAMAGAHGHRPLLPSGLGEVSRDSGLSQNGYGSQHDVEADHSSSSKEPATSVRAPPHVARRTEVLTLATVCDFHMSLFMTAICDMLMTCGIDPRMCYIPGGVGPGMCYTSGSGDTVPQCSASRSQHDVEADHS